MKTQDTDLKQVKGRLWSQNDENCLVRWHGFYKIFNSINGNSGWSRSKGTKTLRMCMKEPRSFLLRWKRLRRCAQRGPPSLTRRFLETERKETHIVRPSKIELRFLEERREITNRGSFSLATESRVLIVLARSFFYNPSMVNT